MMSLMRNRSVGLSEATVAAISTGICKGEDINEASSH